MRLTQLAGQTRRSGPEDGQLLPGLSLLDRAGLLRPLPGGGWMHLPLGLRMLAQLPACLSPQAEGWLRLPFSLPMDTAIQPISLPGGLPPERWLPALAAETASWRSLPRCWQIRQDGSIAWWIALPEGSPLPLTGADAPEACQWAGSGQFAVALPHPDGPEPWLRDTGSGQAAPQPWAERWTGAGMPGDAPLPELVHTPAVKTIAELAAFLGCTPADTLKSVWFRDPDAERVIAVLLRGDCQASEARIAQAAGAARLLPARDEDLRACGAEPGFAGPAGLKRDRLLLLADSALPAAPALTGGANRPDFHLRSLRYGRDYTADQVLPLALARPGDPSPSGGLLESLACWPVWEGGRTSWPAALRWTYLDEGGRPRTPELFRIALHPEILLAALAAAGADAEGCRWPAGLEPASLALISLADDPQTVETAEALYQDLLAAGVQVLYDDRPKKAASPGVRFKDADLRGIPWRLTLSRSTLGQHAAEWRSRDGGGPELLPLGGLAARVATFLSSAPLT